MGGVLTLPLPPSPIPILPITILILPIPIPILPIPVPILPILIPILPFPIPVDTLSLPYMQGTDLSVQVMRQIKPSLSLSCRPPQVAILLEGGHQTSDVSRSIYKSHMHAVMSGIDMVGCSEP